MRDLIGVDTLVNWVAMLRADVDGAILLTNDDSEGPFYERCSHPNARVVPSPNIAIDLLKRITERNVRGVAAAVNDKKLIPLLPDNVFQPSLGEVASLLLASKCCEQTLLEVGGATWLKACEKETVAKSLIDQCIILAIQIEKLYLLNNLTHSENFLVDIIDWSNLTISANGANEVFGSEVIIPPSFFSSPIAADRKKLLLECSGPIVSEIISLSTKKYHPRGLVANREIDAKDLIAMMRISFDLSEIESDPFFWKIRKWEISNKNFPMLKEWRSLDPLQAALDQRYWEEDFRQLLIIEASHSGVSALKLDLDNFKEVNEKLGHSSGDEAIKIACKLLKRFFSNYGTIYRRGGDELVALCPGLVFSDAQKIAENLRESIEFEFKQWGAKLGLKTTPTASVGVITVCSPTPYEEALALLDEAQGRAKKEGKNRVVAFEIKHNEL